MKITILDAYDGDWIAVYKDGEKVYENHSCQLHEGLEALGIEFERQEVFPVQREFWVGNEFPETLSGNG